MEYDILQVEDEPSERRWLEQSAQREHLTYLGVGSLHALEQALNEGSAAKVYVVDGQFPVTEGGEMGFNAPHAIATIRKSYADALIVLHSGHPNAQWCAKEHNVECIGKGINIKSSKLVSVLKEMIQ